MSSTPVSDTPLFESLEGLRGTGKSTIAPLLAAARDAVLVPTVPPSYHELRGEVDRRGNAEARLCFYLSALFTATDEIQAHLSAGVPVVVESYFARCLATHKALGARMAVMLPPGLPQPRAYQLVCSKDERARRLAGRNKPTSRWDALAERAEHQVTSAYARFPACRIETTGLTPDEVVHAILAASLQEAC
jgi:predicted kinase